MKNSLSVVIVTKNRALELSQCLGSLLSNSILPDEIIVVDNNSTDQTKQLIEGIKKNSKVKVKYVFFEGEGYPAVYNRGFKEAFGDWVAFIDDDCLASSSWISEIKKSIKKNPKVSVVMGWCGTHYPHNMFSQATLLFDNEWKRRSLNGKEVVDFEVLDNKNVVYNKSFLDKHQLSYDEKRVICQNGAAEDCDLGMQIQQAGGKAICNKKMMIWHKDPQNWIWFMKKNISSWKAYQSLSLKWNMKERENLKLQPKELLKLVDDFSNEINLSLVAKFELFVVSKQVTLLNKILPIFYPNRKTLNEK